MIKLRTCLCTCSGTCSSQAPPTAPLRRTTVIQGGGNGGVGKSPSYSPQRNWLLISHQWRGTNRWQIHKRDAHLVPGSHFCHFLWSQGASHLLPGETCGCHLIQGHPSITDGHLAPVSPDAVQGGELLTCQHVNYPKSTTLVSLLGYFFRGSFWLYNIPTNSDSGLDLSLLRCPRCQDPGGQIWGENK